MASKNATFREIVEDLWFTYGIVVTAIFVDGATVPESGWGGIPTGNLRVSMHAA